MQGIPAGTNNKTLAAAEVLWEYMKLDIKVRPVDVMFVLGSRDAAWPTGLLNFTGNIFQSRYLFRAG